MAKGENIFKRKDGRWEARYIKGYEPSGKIRYGFCYGKSYKEAKTKVTGCKAALLRGEPIPQASPKRYLSFYCDEWLRLKKPKIRESTYIKYRTIAEKYIKPHMGCFLPSHIVTAVVDEFTRRLMVEDALSPKTTRDILTVLRGVLNYAAGFYPGGLPAVTISLPREHRGETRVLSRAEQERFVRFLQSDMDLCKFGVLLMLLSGIRIGELCALRWGNINFSERTLRINTTLQRLHDTAADSAMRTRIVIGAPKSDSSIRTIPLTEHTAALCRKFAVDDADAYVLTGTAAYMEPRTLQYRLRKYTRACELDGVHAHTLRHTFATRAVEIGFELKSLSEVLGHANTAITLNRYVHSSIEQKRSNMDKLAAVGL